MPAHESLHFLQGNSAIVVGIHRFEYAFVRRLKLLQCEFPVSVSIHQTENYSRYHRIHHAATPISHMVPVELHGERAAMDLLRRRHRRDRDCPDPAGAPIIASSFTQFFASVPFVRLWQIVLQKSLNAQR
jgi:hypothetical protein